LPNRMLAKQATEFSRVSGERTYVKELEIDEKYERGLKIAKASDGECYEVFLNELLQDKFDKKNVKHFGSMSSGQRLSDICYFTDVIDESGEKERILNIVEAKAGNAIKSLDERKEIDNIINLLMELNNKKVKFDGVWFQLVNGDSIPRQHGHGGFRSARNYQYSFEEKLLRIHMAIMNQIWKPVLVTAFSYKEYYNFLQNINLQNERPISKVTTPHYWVWSKKFMDLNYVSILA